MIEEKTKELAAILHYHTAQYSLWNQIINGRSLFFYKLYFQTNSLVDHFPMQALLLPGIIKVYTRNVN